MRTVKNSSKQKKNTSNEDICLKLISISFYLNMIKKNDFIQFLFL